MKKRVKAESISNSITTLFYIVAFIEGSALMACELLSAKFIAPYFGTSLYVWTVVIGTTLGGLALGYYFGGVISEKFPSYKTLLIIIAVSAFFMGIMPFSSAAIMRVTLPMDLKIGVTISCLVFLLPVIVCFGMVSPVIIRLITDKVESVGRFAGTVYAISTVGGILTTFLYGFYLMPYWGLRNGAFLAGFMLLLACGIILLIARKQK